MASKAFIEKIAVEIVKDKRIKQAASKKTAAAERLRVQQILESSERTEAGRVIPLAYCQPGTRFEVVDAPWIRGVAISTTFGSVRVLLDNGHDTTFSKSTTVYTGSQKAEPKAKIKANATPQTAAPAVQRRPRVLGYTSVRLIYFLGARGWDFDKVKQLFEVFGVPIADATVQMTLDSVNNPKYFDPAKVTDEDALKMEMAVE